MGHWTRKGQRSIPEALAGAVRAGRDEQEFPDNRQAPHWLALIVLLAVLLASAVRGML